MLFHHAAECVTPGRPGPWDTKDLQILEEFHVIYGSLESATIDLHLLLDQLQIVLSNKAIIVIGYGEVLILENLDEILVTYDPTAWLLFKLDKKII